MFTKKQIQILGLVLLLAAGLATYLLQPRADGPTRTITIGIQTSPAMALVMVAKDKGFFDRHGANVELKEFTAGKFALQAFLGGSIDYAVSGEVPAALALMQGNDLHVVAQVVKHTTDEVRVVALKDGTEQDPKSYFFAKKRKLSTSLGGGPEMFTYSFLKHYGIDQSQVEIVSQKPEDMPAALETKSVDAISIFDPYAWIAEQRLGDRAVTFTVKQGYSELYVLNARREQIATDGNTIEALLAALADAATFIQEHPNDAKAVVRKYTKLDSAVVDGIWNNFAFEPALTPLLLDYWKREAEWAKTTGKIKTDTVIPDFTKQIEKRFLQKVLPGAVTLP